MTTVEDKLTLPVLPDGYRWELELTPNFEKRILRIQRLVTTSEEVAIELGWWRSFLEGYRNRQWPTHTVATTEWKKSYGEVVWPLSGSDNWETRVEVIAHTMLGKLVRFLDNKVKLQRLRVAIEESNNNA